MASARVTNETDPDTVELQSGMVLVSPHGSVRILRSRTSADNGWNCSDGASIADEIANDPREWTAYTPDELAASLRLARELTEISGHRVLTGGLATWDACSGRPCMLPKLSRLVR